MDAARLCIFALTVSNLAAPAPFRLGLVLMGMRLLPANTQDGSMSEFASYSPPFAASGTADMRHFAGIGRRLLDTLHAWRIRTLQRSELMMLNRVELRELSVTEADVNRETGRPFWESIDLNGR